MDFEFETQIPTELESASIILKYYKDQDGEHRIIRFGTQYRDQNGREIEESPGGDFEPYMTVGDKERAEQLLNKVISKAKKPLKK